MGILGDFLGSAVSGMAERLERQALEDAREIPRLLQQLGRHRNDSVGQDIKRRIKQTMNVLKTGGPEARRMYSRIADRFGREFDRNNIPI